ncbi:uncharacterized protein LOC119027620 [Acanthopagrus latus]|uniref:uncharacterized protein LOC119027620 n=1 Tax=Acanthopagrus latus TaxID=8177 RepID=UPI00187BCE0D|nr:uncharacterized protein LOC119027620 [Acanthopagrus latus]
MALKSLLDTESANPYFRPPPLKISVLKMIDSPKVISWDFSTATVKPAVTKFNKTAVLSDGQPCTKVTLFQQFAEKIKEGFTYIMRGHTIRGSNPPYFLYITERTMFFRTTPMTVSEQLHQQAEALLCPRSPLTPLHECHTSEGLITLEGKVVEVLPVKKIRLDGDHIVPLKKVKLQQGSDSVDLCLWREAALEHLHAGQKITVTHVKATHANLQSTIHTSFKKPET